MTQIEPKMLVFEARQQHYCLNLQAVIYSTYLPRSEVYRPKHSTPILEIALQSDAAAPFVFRPYDFDTVADFIQLVTVFHDLDDEQRANLFTQALENKQAWSEYQEAMAAEKREHNAEFEALQAEIEQAYNEAKVLTQNDLWADSVEIPF